MKGRSGKARKTKGRNKAAKAARGRSAKSKKSSKARKPTKLAARRKTGRKQAPARKNTSRTKSRARKDVFGEGNYTASREFRRQESGFVQRNPNRIPKMGEQAAEALEGDEGKELRQAEETARSHSAGDDED